MACWRPASAMAAFTVARAKPEISMSLPNSAPSMKTGKYSFTNCAILSMNTPAYTGATSAGSVSSTASNAATGANRMTLWPR